MAKLQVVITTNGEGWYLADESGNETEESVPWGDVLEFDGTLYRADVDESGDDVSLFKVIAMPESAYETVSEDDSEDDSDETDEDDEAVASAAD